MIKRLIRNLVDHLYWKYQEEDNWNMKMNEPISMHVISEDELADLKKKKQEQIEKIRVGMEAKTNTEKESEIKESTCIATQSLINKGISQGIRQGENRLTELFKKIQSNPEEMNRALNADEKERQEMYRQYGIIE